jgi:tetratricopeptide (TPR) repeat protein
MGAAQAQGSVTVIGGGLAEACSRAALTGKTDIRFEKACSDALDQETLSARDRAGTYVNRGILKLRRANWAAAMKDFNQAVRTKPDLGEAYVNRDLNKGIELGIEEPAKAYYNRALAYEGLDDLKSAYFDYQKAVELSPDWAAPREQLVRFKVSRKEE